MITFPPLPPVVNLPYPSAPGNATASLFSPGCGWTTGFVRPSRSDFSLIEHPGKNRRRMKTGNIILIISKGISKRRLLVPMVLRK
jgi:hypothetical protein